MNIFCLKLTLQLQVMFLILIIQRAANSVQAKKCVHVHTGNCGTPHHFFLLPVAMTHKSFLSLSVSNWLMFLFFGAVEAIFILGHDVNVQFSCLISSSSCCDSSESERWNETQAILIDEQVMYLIPIVQRAANAKQAKTVCVRAGRCGAAPLVFRFLDGLIYILFLSHFSVTRMRIYFSCFALGLFELIYPLCCGCLLWGLESCLDLT
jgi:hypothetical protein